MKQPQVKEMTETRQIYETSPITKDTIEATVKAIKTFESSKKFKEEELEELAKKAILLQKTSDENWLILELDNFHDNKKNEEEKEKLKQIKPSEPVLIKGQKDLEDVVEKHTVWINSILGTGNLLNGSRANLSSADLAGLSLENCNLSCANLDGASLIGAKLVKVNLSKASFKKTSLEGAHIQNCVFHKADLKGADFREADIMDTNFTDEQKKEAEGLF